MLLDVESDTAATIEASKACSHRKTNVLCMPLKSHPEGERSPVGGQYFNLAARVFQRFRRTGMPTSHWLQKLTIAVSFRRQVGSLILFLGVSCLYLHELLYALMLDRVVFSAYGWKE